MSGVWRPGCPECRRRMIPLVALEIELGHDVATAEIAERRQAYGCEACGATAIFDLATGKRVPAGERGAKVRNDGRRD